METINAGQVSKYPLLSEVVLSAHEEIHPEFKRTILVDNAIKASLLIPQHGGVYLLKEYGQPHLLVLPHVQDAFKRGQSTSVRNLERRYRSAAGRDLRADLDRIMLGDKRTGTLTRIVNIFMHDGIVELHRTWFGAQKITEGRIYRKIRVFDSSVMQSVDEEAQKEYRIDPATRVR